MRIKRLINLTLCFSVIAIFVAPPLAADDEIEAGQKYRVQLLSGREVVGEVTVTATAYKVKSASGITETFKKSEVRQILPYEEATEADRAADRPALAITKDEIDELLGDESVEDLYVWDYVEKTDLMAPLETNRDSVELMKRMAGRAAKVLDTDHFVFVYTSPPSGARRLAARLEMCWKWNAAFARMFDIPAKRPDHKLEVFYFDTYDEYEAYQSLNGFRMMGALGFYMATNNRCAFYDMNTYPPVAAALGGSNDTSSSPQERRKQRNLYKRWSDWMTLEVVQHEATHAIQFNIGIFPKFGDAGKWMTEGLCVQFEVAPGITGGSFGSINYGRLDDWHTMYGENGEAVPWTFVKNMVMSDAMGYHDYVMGWALNYYLRKEFKEEYGEWMRSLAARENNWAVRTSMAERLTAFEDCFGTLDEEWVSTMFEYIAAIPMRESAIVRNPSRP